MICMCVLTCMRLVLAGAEAQIEFVCIEWKKEAKGRQS